MPLARYIVAIIVVAILILMLIIVAALIRMINSKRRSKPVDTATDGLEKQPTKGAENLANDEGYSTVDVTLGKS